MNTSSLVYRRAEADDGDALARIHVTSWRTFYRGALRDAYLDGDIQTERSKLWMDRLMRPHDQQLVLVAEAAGAPVGFACAFGAHDSRWGTLLDNLHVLPDWQKSGIGKALIVRVAQWASSTYSESGLYLWVLEQNADAQAFYRRVGGRDVEGDAWVPPGGGLVNRRRYAWSPSELNVLARLDGREKAAALEEPASPCDR